MNLDSSVRLNKYISDSGYCSRREADKLIEANRVQVNGKQPELGTRVCSGDEVTVDDMEIYSSAPNKNDRIYLAYNKPVGITCTTEQDVKGNIVDAIDHDERIFPIGRLDKSSDGLILMTNDGDIVNKILRAENAHDKEYIVNVNKSLDTQFASNMANGVPILGTKTKPCKVSIINKTTFKITLTEGLNRQIRRMCSYFGYEVKSLSRMRIMNIQLGNLRSGQWRKLTSDELSQLSDAISNSSSEAKKPTRRRRKPSSNYQGKNAHFIAGYSSHKKTDDDNRGEKSSKSKNSKDNNTRKSAKTSGDGKQTTKPSKHSTRTKGSHSSGKPTTRNSSSGKPTSSRQSAGKGSASKAKPAAGNRPSKKRR